MEQFWGEIIICCYLCLTPRSTRIITLQTWLCYAVIEIVALVLNKECTVEPEPGASHRSARKLPSLPIDPIANCRLGKRNAFKLLSKGARLNSGAGWTTLRTMIALCGFGIRRPVFGQTLVRWLLHLLLQPCSSLSISNIPFSLSSE